MQNDENNMEESTETSKKLNVKFSYYPGIPLLSLQPKEVKMGFHC